MKQYLSGVLILSVVFFSGALPTKVNAGLTTAQQNIITMLQNSGATAQAIAQVQSAFGVIPTNSSTGTTSTTTVSTGNTNLPCTNNAAFNFNNGNPCANYVPTTAAGTTNTTTTTTSTTNPVNPNAIYPYGTTPTNSNTPSTTLSNCISNQIAINPYVIINGGQVQCVKVCTGQIAWNVITNSMCSLVTNVVSTTSNTPSITVVAPNGAEEYAPGAVTGVKWSSTNISSTNDQVYILLNYYTPDGAFITSTKLVDNTTLNDGGEVVTLPTTLPVGASWGNNFKVTVGIANVATDDSDKNFIIE
jgi:hypothetical protein